MAEAELHMSYAEYLALAEQAELKHEFIEGLVVAMAGGTIEHSRLVARTSYLLMQALEGKPCNVFSSDGRVRIEATNRATYPDVSVVCGRVQPAQDAPHVEVFRREGELWVLREHGPGATIELDSLGVTLALDRLYVDPSQA